MKKSVFIPLLFLSLFLPALVFAQTYSQIIALGDSLSDNGPGDGYGFQRYTDSDKVWVELLSDVMGSTLIDVAYGGSTTGSGDLTLPPAPIPTLMQQTSFFAPLQQDTLFTVWSGANNLLRPLSANMLPGDYITAANEVFAAIDQLADPNGSTDILLLNLPDIGLTPAFYNTPYQVGVSGWTTGFNATLSGLLSAYSGPANIFMLDVFAIFNDLLDVNGTTINLSDAEYDALFWDTVHPSFIGHQRLADEAWIALGNAPVPEPSTILLFGAGLAGLAGTNRRKR